MFSLATHIDEIEKASQGVAIARDPQVVRSWLRCLDQHRLDPARTREAYILPAARLREHQQRSEALIRIARAGLEHLFRQMAGQRYVLLLSDPDGVTVDFLGHADQAPALRKAGLFLGAEWSEGRAGTCAVGTCLQTGKALTVHKADHFDGTHAALSCTAAPIHDVDGRLAAVLDLSLLESPDARSSQSLALHLLRMTTQRIEMANLMARCRDGWILRLARQPEFVDSDPEAALALDERGRIRGLTRQAERLLGRAAGIGQPAPGQLLGQALENFLDVSPEQLPRCRQVHAPQHRIVTLRDGSRLFAQAIEPAPPPAGGSPSGRGTAATSHAATSVPGHACATPAAHPARVAAPPDSSPGTAPSDPAPDSATPLSDSSARRSTRGSRWQALSSLAGEDRAMNTLLHKAARLACHGLPLLLQGETGVGKECLARAIHRYSGRPGPFIGVNCAAIPESLIESELFGHLPGAYTGAAPKGRKGLVEASDGGTLFLDEIGDMPLLLQSRLLRVLAESEVTPIGASTPRRVRISLICASHRNLDEAVRDGRFREDLFYRINAVTLRIPPLRERADLGWLIDTILAQHQDERALPTLAPAARLALLGHAWPGNVRELRNALAVAAALCENGSIEADDLPEAVRSSVIPTDDERGAILHRTLARCRGNVSEAARLLGIDRSTLHRQLKRHGIRVPR